MRTIKKEDLNGVFLLVVRPSKNFRDHLPYVRRHFKSVANLCRVHIEHQIDIYYSGIFVADKKPHSHKIVMDREYRELAENSSFTFQV